MSSAERSCVISFDEMKVLRKACYDKQTDTVYGPCNQVLVIMVRGLVSKWKQPIYFDFDVRLSKSLFDTIVESLEKVGLLVVAAVSDLAGSNRKLWKELGINTENTRYPNPYGPNRNIHFFVDIPHLIKLLRNHFLDAGYIMPSGKIVTKNPLFQLIEKDCNEIRMCVKLRESHINVRGTDRQRVKYATELFSESVSKSVRYVFPSEETLSNFILAVDKFFDAFNSRIPHDFGKPCFGQLIREQKHILLQMLMPRHEKSRE